MRKNANKKFFFWIFHHLLDNAVGVRSTHAIQVIPVCRPWLYDCDAMQMANLVAPKYFVEHQSAIPTNWAIQANEEDGRKTMNIHPDKQRRIFI
jgi:hypothetical protein